jgi:hypothetical protein
MLRDRSDGHSSGARSGHVATSATRHSDHWDATQPGRVAGRVPADRLALVNDLVDQHRGLLRALLERLEALQQMWDVLDLWGAHVLALP